VCADEKKNRSIYSLFSKKETPFLTTREFVVNKVIMALAPDVSGLVGYPSTIYRYTPFPSLNAKLFPHPRDIPSFSDATVRSKDDQGMLRAGLLSLLGMNRRGPDAETSALGALSHLSSNSTDLNVYTIWFLAFVACLHIVSDEIT
jgi:hypothetical protein